MSNSENAFILKVKSCYTPDRKIEECSIICRDGAIEAIGAYDVLEVLEDIPTIDMSDCHVIPGLVDTHLHGAGGIAAMTVDSVESLNKLSLCLAKHGVTAFLLTVISAGKKTMIDVVDRLARLTEKPLAGAQMVGFHYEGPYLSQEKRGAQPEKYIREVDLGEARELLSAGQGRTRMATFAPELSRSEKLIELLLEHNVVPSMGHSAAGEEDVRRAIEAGACRVTHLFNGTPRLDQRHSGLTAVALEDERVSVELTVDGVHVHPDMIKLACRSKAPEKIIGVSDATQGAGQPDGSYHLGDVEVEIRNGTCRRYVDGKLAGSALTLDLALRNLNKFSGLPCEQALACYCRNPARDISIHDRGLIQPGKRADLVLMDKDWNVRMTLIGGKIVYSTVDESVYRKSKS